MTRFRPVAILLLILTLLAPPAWAQSQNNPIPGIDVVVQKKPSGNTLVVPLDSGGIPGRLSLGAGEWSIALQCRGGGGCRLPAFTALTIDGRRYVLPGPGTALDLNLGDAPGDRDVRLEVQTNLGTTPVNGIGGTGGGRYTIAADPADQSTQGLRIIADVSTLRVAPGAGAASDPHGLGEAGHDSGGGGGGAGGAGAP